jgi:hypothetical protein
MIMGVVFLVVGILGFVPPLLTHPATDAHHGGLVVTAFEGYLLGLFHVNVLHSLVHVLFGILGIAMSRSFDAARLYARIVAVAYALLAVMGLFAGLNTLFGFVPIHGNDVWLHAVIAIIAAYFGFAATDRTDVGAVPPAGTV